MLHEAGVLTEVTECNAWPGCFTPGYDAMTRRYQHCLLIKVEQRIIELARQETYEWSSKHVRIGADEPEAVSPD
jgi:hypothetical protein